MARVIHVRVITNEGHALTDEAVSVRAPGGLGSMGFLYNHAPLVTTIQPGIFSWRRPDGARHALRVEGGLLEVTHNTLTLLTTSVAEVTPRPAES